MNRLSKLILLALVLCVVTALIQEVQISILDRRAEVLIKELQDMHYGLDAFTDAALGVVAGIKKNFAGVAVAISKVGRDLWVGIGRRAEIKHELEEIAAYYHTLILWRNGALVAASALGVVTIVRRYRTPKAS